MSTAPVADMLFQVAGVGMLLHFACSAWLRTLIKPGSDIFGDLFGTPIFGDIANSPWMLRGRYFLPWVKAPVQLKAYPILPRLLFWGARLGADLLIFGMSAFLLSMFWEAGHT